MTEKAAPVTERVGAKEAPAHEECCAPDCGPGACDSQAAQALPVVEEEEVEEQCCGSECGPETCAC